MLRMFGYSWVLHVGGKIGRAVSEACRTTRNLGTSLAVGVEPRKTPENFDPIGRSQDFLDSERAFRRSCLQTLAAVPVFAGVLF